ncbi:MAG: hydrolase [bacterium]
MQLKKRFTAKSVQLLVVDLQERLLPVIAGGDLVRANARRLIQAARWLEIDCLATEQYPKGLGPTVPDIAEVYAAQAIEKMTFSAVGPESVRYWLEPDQVVVLTGIETHVCIAQTTFDLIEMGISVLLPVDAVSSRNRADHEIAITRMVQAGVIPTSTEALLFEWLGSAEHPQFKAISKMVKEFESDRSSDAK